MKRINKIINSGLCLGCGLCESISTSDKCEMKLDDNGFYYPSFKKRLTEQEKKSILLCCPAINVNGTGEKKVWGEVKLVSESWANDFALRKAASSGGVISALAIHLLKTKKVDGILHVGLKKDSYIYNELKISKTADDVILNIGSRYAPSLVLGRIKQILDKTTDIFAFIGKPCDIAGIKNLVEVNPEYNNRIVFYIGIFCAGMPSLNGTKKMIKFANTEEAPVSLKYRGDGWPGYFEVNYKNSPTFKLSYNESWRTVLSKYVGFRCRICPDGIGLLADIVVGDSWSTKDGFADFEERDGRSFVLIRTSKGDGLFEDAVANSEIQSNPLELGMIKQMQQYQHKRRMLVGYRLIPVQILTGFILNFRRLGIWNLMLKANPKSGLLNMIGTGRRFIFKKSNFSINE